MTYALSRLPLALRLNSIKILLKLWSELVNIKNVVVAGTILLMLAVTLSILIYVAVASVIFLRAVSIAYLLKVD